MKIKFFVMSFLALSLFSCGEEQQQQPTAAAQPQVEVSAKTVEFEDIYFNKNYPASIVGKDYVDIRPKVSGYVEKWSVEEGAKVRKGQTIIKISEDNFLQAYNAAKASVAVAEATVANSKLDVERTQSLYDNKIVSEFDLRSSENNYELAKAQLLQAQANYDNAKLNLGYTNVVSPVNGVIGKIVPTSGTLVSPSDPVAITTVSDNKNMYAYFTMSETEILNLTQAADNSAIKDAFQNPKLILSNGVDYDKEGTLDMVTGVVDKSTGTVTLRASFKNSGDLRGGSNGYIVLPVLMKSIALVPQKATIAQQDKTMVYTVNNDGVVGVKFLQVMPQEHGEDFVVVGGLEEGDKIVTNNIINVRPGMKVTIKN